MRRMKSPGMLVLLAGYTARMDHKIVLVLLDYIRHRYYWLSSLFNAERITLLMKR